MSTETAALPLDFDLELDLVRPVTADRPGRGRKLRSLIGVRESLLDWVPEERKRYTLLGAIVLNTAIMAGFSLMVGLAGLAGGWWILLAPAGLFWGYLILTFDSWLISSTHGATNRSKWGMFFPRFVVSLLLGFIIAEPLVLWVFKPSIDVEIREDRKAQLDQYESRLRACSSTDGSVTAPDNCAGFNLNVADNPQALVIELTNAKSTESQSKTSLDALNAELSNLERLARDECSGTPGPGVSGDKGEGELCLNNRAAAARFRTENHIDQLRTDLISLQRKIVTLTGEVSAAQERYTGNVTAEIGRKLAEKKDNLSSRGILDDLHALSRLSDENFEIKVAHWLLAALLIAVDCLPVLAKAFGGTTAYDAIVSQRLEASKQSFSRRLSVRESREGADADIGREAIEQELRENRRSIAEAERSANARREAELADEIDRLAMQLEIDEDDDHHTAYPTATPA
ncbi:DUF4407 domain-containing protein [Nocardia bovistercoris]|uniref:DUF4407 domain-containing protein n=1 Tax=Nocardia bovistercoris TaxID=2785916 RepID=A0A931IJQ7_9NOCA|nr:DUF4407 domain-containing protein [Nocardia bovistercoris]MBH0781262.1 DUF4407 domain-containing protein [Nocardia bovistercoris]